MNSIKTQLKRQIKLVGEIKGNNKKDLKTIAREAGIQYSGFLKWYNDDNINMTEKNLEKVATVLGKSLLLVDKQVIGGESKPKVKVINLSDDVKETKILFKDEPHPFIVKSNKGRYAICTKPYNPKKTVIYTIVDFDKDIRSTVSNVLSPYDFNTQEDIDKCMEDLFSGKTYLSLRNQIKLEIEDIILPKK